MADGPWVKYKGQQGPWTKYQAAAETVAPANAPSQPGTSAIGREFALGALGTVAPETQSPLMDMAKGAQPNFRNPMTYIDPAGVGRGAVGIAQKLGQGISEVAGNFAELTPGRRLGGTPIPNEAQEEIAHGAGILSTLGLGGLTAARTKPLANVQATQAAEIATKRANNLSAALENAGVKAPPGVRIYEDIATVLQEDLPRKAMELKVKPSDISSWVHRNLPFTEGAGRGAYLKMQKIFNGLKQEYADVWNKQVIEPVKDFPGRKVGKDAVVRFRENFNKTAELLKEIKFANVDKFVKSMEEYIMRHSETFGTLDAARKDLNRVVGDFLAQSGNDTINAAAKKQIAAATDRGIRNALYPAIEEAYGPQAAGKLKPFQRKHGAAIEAADLMEQAGNTMSRQASIEAGVIPAVEKIPALLSRATIPTEARAVAATSGTFMTPSRMRVFAAQMAEAIKPTGVSLGKVPAPVPSHDPAMPMDLRDIMGRVGARQRGTNFGPR